MRIGFWLIAAGLLAACAPEKGDPGASCTVVEPEGMPPEIRCEDGTRVTLPAGEDGKDGENGGGCTVTDNGDGTKTIACTDGTSVTLRDGEDGEPGVDGVSCALEANGDGTYTLSCTDGSSMVIRNGEDGQDGEGCTLTDNGDGTATIVCGSGPEVTIPLHTCPGDFRAPGFDVGAYWPVAGVGNLAELSPGHAGPGRAELIAEPSCEDTVVRQTLCVGERHERGPLAVRVWHLASCTGCSLPASLRVTNGTNTSKQPLGVATDAWGESTACLGELAYGESVELAFGFMAEACSPSADVLLYDDAAIVESNELECPRVGEVRNGDFRFGTFGWKHGGGGSLTDRTASDPSGVGLTAVTGCDEPSIEGLVSVPLAGTLPGAAIRIRGDSFGDPVRVTVESGAVRSVDLAPIAPGSAGTVCLRDDERGAVLPVRITSPAPASCATTGPRQLFVAEVALTTDDSCP